MARYVNNLKSHATYRAWDLDDDRIMIDIETELVLARKNRAEAMEPIFHSLREGRTLGPLSVLLILVVYFLLSPLLSPAIHEYIYHILR